MPGNHWTWDDFYKICQKVTKDTDGDGRLDQFGVYNYKWNDATLSNGGTLFNQSGTNATCHPNQLKMQSSLQRRLKRYHLFEI